MIVQQQEIADLKQSLSKLVPVPGQKSQDEAMRN